jgi:hypothetical protein
MTSAAPTPSDTALADALLLCCAVAVHVRPPSWSWLAAVPDAARHVVDVTLAGYSADELRGRWRRVPDALRDGHWAAARDLTVTLYCDRPGVKELPRVYPLHPPCAV